MPKTVKRVEFFLFEDLHRRGKDNYHIFEEDVREVPDRFSLWISQYIFPAPPKYASIFLKVLDRFLGENDVNEFFSYEEVLQALKLAKRIESSRDALHNLCIQHKILHPVIEDLTPKQAQKALHLSFDPSHPDSYYPLMEKFRAIKAVYSFSYLAVLDSYSEVITKWHS